MVKMIYMVIYIPPILGVLGGLSVWVIIHLSLWDGYYVWWDVKAIVPEKTFSRLWDVLLLLDH